MALQDALNRLNEPANSQINWTFGDLLRARATRADWLKCLLLKQLETQAQPNLNAWNELCRRTRESLANEADLQRKAESLLVPDGPQFDLNLDDFLAEMLGAIYLSILGHTNITFPTGNTLRPILFVIRLHEEFGRFFQALHSADCFVDSVIYQVQGFVQMRFLHDQKSLLRRGREFDG